MHDETKSLNSPLTLETLLGIFRSVQGPRAEALTKNNPPATLYKAVSMALMSEPMDTSNKVISLLNTALFEASKRDRAGVYEMLLTLFPTAKEALTDRYTFSHSYIFLMKTVSDLDGFSDYIKTEWAFLDTESTKESAAEVFKQFLCTLFYQYHGNFKPEGARRDSRDMQAFCDALNLDFYALAGETLESGYALFDGRLPFLELHHWDPRFFARSTTQTALRILAHGCLEPCAKFFHAVSTLPSFNFDKLLHMALRSYGRKHDHFHGELDQMVRFLMNHRKMPYNAENILLYFNPAKKTGEIDGFVGICHGLILSELLNPAEQDQLFLVYESVIEKYEAAYDGSDLYTKPPTHLFPVLSMWIEARTSRRELTQNLSEDIDQRGEYRIRKI